MTFAQELRAWRGGRRQKEVCDIFGVTLVTYQKWEQGIQEPRELALEQVRWRMAADAAGVPIEVYRHRYLSVIKQVSEEILSRK